MERTLYVVKSDDGYMRPSPGGEVRWGPFQAAMIFFTEYNAHLTAEEVGGHVEAAVLTPKWYEGAHEGAH